MQYVLLMLLFFSPLLQAANITAQVDRNVLHLNESFQLVLEASGSLDDDPDFSPLEQDFDIVSRSQSSNISIINGSYSKTIKWSLTLMARQAGVITIPSIAFGKDRSPQLRITIKPASAPGTGQGDDLYLEVETAASKAYVQGQVLVTVKMLSGENIARYSITDLVHEGVDVVVEQLGDDKQYRAYRGSKPYLVLERTYAVFPQQAGKLHINPFRGEVDVSTGGGSMFDPFRQRSRLKRVRSRGLDIEVQGIPKSFAGSHWLPATELQLVEEWPDSVDGRPVFKVGEPVTRTLSILADGLTSAQLPELAQDSIPGIKQYPDQPSLHDNKKNDGIIGIREQRTALIPTRPGDYTLPAIEIPWWNVSTGKMETARIAARQIHVAAGSSSSATTDNADTTPAPQPLTTPPPQVEAMPAPAATTATTTDDSWPWKLLSLVLAICWLATLLIWWWSRHRSRPLDTTGNAPRASLAQAMKNLHRACQGGSAADCQQALIAWGRQYYGSAQISNPGEIGARAGEPLHSAIRELESALYSRTPGSWNGADLAAICQRMTEQQKPVKEAVSSGLEPLYK